MSLQEISCTVQNCAHNQLGKSCSLSGIVVGESNHTPNNARDTQCGSFECC